MQFEGEDRGVGGGRGAERRGREVQGAVEGYLALEEQDQAFGGGEQKRADQEEGGRGPAVSGVGAEGGAEG